MLIGFDASRVSKKERSGVEWYSHHLLKQLFKLDKKNRYFLYTPEFLASDLKPLPENFKEKVLGWPLSKFWTQGRLSLELLKKKPDILFIPAHIFPFVLGRKNVITWPDVGHKHFPNCYSKSQLKVIEYGLKRAVKVADKIITISEFSKQELVNYYQINPSKIAVIYLGYDASVFYPRNTEAVSQVKAKYILKNPYLLYVGRLAKRKNLVNLIEAYKQLRQTYPLEIDLVLAGSQNFGYEEVLEKINQSSYQQSIKLLGYVAENNLPALISGAECLTHPSLFEGFGLTILEAMACGCPVVCSNSGSLPEVGQDAVLYFNPQNSKDICQKILSVLQNLGSRDFQSRQRDELIQRGFKRAKDFSWEKCAKETLAILNDL